jgi:hypothetical protein
MISLEISNLDMLVARALKNSQPTCGDITLFARRCTNQGSGEISRLLRSGPCLVFGSFAKEARFGSDSGALWSAGSQFTDW